MTYNDLLTLIIARGVHPLLGDMGQGFCIEQNAHELATFLEAMFDLDVHKVLEIGTGHRAGLARFLANDLGWRVVTLDKDQPQIVATNVEFLMGSSAILRPLFEGSTFDLIILDGDNTYEGVVKDYDMYAPLATKAVAVCKIGGHRGCEGVARFWHELELHLRTEHVLAEGEQCSGIGWYPVRKEAALELEYARPMYDTGEEIEDDDLDELIHKPVIVEEEDLPPTPMPKKKRGRPKKSA